jgi:glycine/D-amino acid oxidase-like deaminating enzyme
VGRAAASAGLDIDYAKGGTLAFARSPVQLAAARAEVAEAAGFGVDPIELLGPQPAAGSLAATFDPNCARIHPAKLVRGLARALERRGVRIFERTEVLDYAPHTVVTAAGTVRCDRVVAATEGYGATLPPTRRRVLPLYSLMIATAPLSEHAWQAIGIEHGQTFTDHRHLIVYGQRTADDRLAFGGRGARYHWGSAIRSGYDRVPRVFEHLRRTLTEMFPVIGDVEITHRWGGPLGVPRDWHASVGYDRGTGIATAGGYVGDGLSTTNLAGRTLADLLTDTDSELVRLPWVGHRSPSWESEPLRFLGANAGLLAMTVADAEERMTRRPSLAARLMGRLTGH